MKKLTVIALTAFMLMGSFVAKAQGKFGADSAECIKYLSYYSEYYKQKNYDEALPNWRQAYKLCPPQASQNLFINGATLMKRVISANAKNPEAQKAAVDTLLAMYDTRAKFYPKNKETALNNKGVDLNNYVKNDPQRIYDETKNIIAELGAGTKPSIFIFTKLF